LKTLKLKSGHEIPLLGIGTWNMGGAVCEKSVRAALEMGYRHIDTADIYGNHREVGKGIKGYDRSGLFITSKVWRSDLAYDKVIERCNKSLKEIGTDYLDLYLMHYPNDRFPIAETMRAFKKLVEDGKIRSAGVSNFYDEWLKEVIEVSEIPVVTNQVEFHPHLYQRELLDFCTKNGVAVTAYSPLARGQILDDPVLKDIAGKHGKSVAQVSLRWLIQHGMIVIPKSSSEDHLRENMDVFDWKLTAKEMEAVDSIKTWNRLVNPAFIEAPLFDRIPKGVLKRMPGGLRKTLGKRFFRD
jgi:2,5-diketo-D-gluconate reductase B